MVRKINLHLFEVHIIFASALEITDILSADAKNDVPESVKKSLLGRLYKYSGEAGDKGNVPD